jgi:pilus assembly protein CpaF
VRAYALDERVVLGAMTAQAASFIEAVVVSGLNVLVAGGTQAGRPTSR